MYQLIVRGLTGELHSDHLIHLLILTIVLSPLHAFLRPSSLLGEIYAEGGSSTLPVARLLDLSLQLLDSAF